MLEVKEDAETRAESERLAKVSQVGLEEARLYCAVPANRSMRQTNFSLKALLSLLLA